MSYPPINPEKSLAGIAVDPLTLERVVPESRRPDGRYTLDHHIRWCSG
jgi:partner of Y14 and mago protein